LHNLIQTILIITLKLTQTNCKSRQIIIFKIFSLLQPTSIFIITLRVVPKELTLYQINNS